MMQATLEDFRPKRKIFKEFDYLIQEYIKAYGTDDYDNKYNKYHVLYNFTGN